VTSEVDEAGDQMRRTLAGCFDAGGPSPGALAGAGCRRGRDEQSDYAWNRGAHTVRSLPPKRFLKLLTQCDVSGGELVGRHSRSELSGRARGEHRLTAARARTCAECDGCAASVDAIARAVQRQIAHGRYPLSTLYGDGTAGERTADVICERVGAHSRA
jgi:hypothetical protein